MQEEVVETQVATLPLEDLVACHECDLLMQKPRIEIGQGLECPRCGFELYSLRHQFDKRSLALVLTALMLYIPANFLPIMQLNLLGRTSQDTIWSGVVGLHESGMEGVALIVFLCSMGIPLLKLLCQLFVLLSIHFRYGRAYGMLLYRIYHHLREWGMLEVYMMGILVSVVKLVDLADLTLGIGLACFIGLLLVQVWLEITMSPHQVWNALAERNAHARD
jgi:paraquat-inducible protein A